MKVQGLRGVGTCELRYKGPRGSKCLDEANSAISGSHLLLPASRKQPAPVAVGNPGGSGQGQALARRPAGSSAGGRRGYRAGSAGRDVVLFPRGGLDLGGTGEHEGWWA